jgi:hypothetical protein
MPAMVRATSKEFQKRPKKRRGTLVVTSDFDEIPNKQNIVFVDAETTRKAEQQIVSCESCNREEAEFLFSEILDSLIGNDPTVTEYVLEIPAKCPRCGAAVTEESLVEWDGGDHLAEQSG